MIQKIQYEKSPNSIKWKVGVVYQRILELTESITFKSIDIESIWMNA